MDPQPDPSPRLGDHAAVDAVAYRIIEILAAASSGLVGDARRRGDLLTIADAAAIVRCSPRTLRRAVQTGRLEAMQPAGRGGRLLISMAELERWLAPAERRADPKVRRRTPRHRGGGGGPPERIQIGDVRRRPRDP